jgi:hypothetical protein
VDEADDLSRVAQYVAVQNDLYEPRRLIQEELQNAVRPNFRDPDELHGVLADLKLPVYVTTNYDDFMVEALRDRQADPKQDWCRWNEATQKSAAERPPLFPDGVYKATPANPVVYHMFGQIGDPNSLVLTEDDYLEFLAYMVREDKPIPPRIDQAIAQATLLFLGYRPTDLGFRVLLRSLLTKLKNYKHVAVQIVAFGDEVSPQQIERSMEYLDRRYQELDKLKVAVVWGTSCRQFITELRQRLEEHRKHAN